MRLALRSALLLLALLPLPAAADTGSPAAMVAPEVRIGSHPGFGRVVFDFPHHVDYTISRDGDRVLLRFAEPTVIGDPGGVPRNVAAIVAHGDTVEITVVPGAQLHPARLGDRVVLDVIDPAAPRRADPRPGPAKIGQAAAQPQATPQAAAKTVGSPVENPAPPVAARPSASPAGIATHVASLHRSPIPPDRERVPAPPETARTPPAAPPPASPATPPDIASPVIAAPVGAPPAATPDAPASTPAPATPAAVPAQTGPANGAMALAARLIVQPPGIPGSAVFLPLAAETGAAAFRRGDTAIAVFGERRPLDLGALHDDPGFGGAAIQLLPAATLLTMKLPPATELRLTRVIGGWTLAVGPTGAPVRPITAAAAGPALKFAADGAAQVVVVPDPETGENLLVGTQLRPGQGIGVSRHAAQFTLDPSWQGVVVEPLSDQVSLHGLPDGFLLSSGGAPLELSATQDEVDAAVAASRFTRRYDFPNLPATALLHRLQQQVLAAADAPVQSRAEPRRGAAQVMVALGMGAEAQSLLQLAAQEDPGAGGPDLAGLAAIGALLSGRIGESQAIDDPALTGTDEVALWRAVRAAKLHEGAPAAAAVFANTLPLILSYPAALRSRILPLAAETMASGGAAAAAQLLVASRPDDPTLAYARGLLLAGKGDTAGALTVFDALAQGRDQFDSARAAEQGVELRLAAGRFTPAQAADALEKQFMAWRGDDRELRLRFRVVDLRTHAGQFRPALALLRETQAGWPDQGPAIRARMGDVFTALLQQGDPNAISPLDLVSLADDNADVLPDGAAGEKLAGLLADKLAALDLPRRAAPVLQKLAQASSGAARAAYGARLAEMQLRDGNADAARQALDASRADGLAPELATRRALLEARTLAQQGKSAEATALLAGLDDPGADELRADIAEGAKDWHAAETALRALAARRLPPDGELDDAQQSLLLRLAGAASQAGDVAALAGLRQHEGPRMQRGKLNNMFRLLTEAPVKSVADLPRAAAEASLASAVPAGLQALRTP